MDKCRKKKTKAAGGEANAIRRPVISKITKPKITGKKKSTKENRS